LRQEKERLGGFFEKLWDKFKAISYGKKATTGAVFAGVLGGSAAALGGAGFAALGIGAALFVRRFFGGFVVGGGIKGVADRLISRKERRELDEETAKRVEEISEEISSLINNPEKAPRSYENWLRLAKHLDERLKDVLYERDNIREKNNKKRKLWTIIAALVGGLAANADNLYNLLTGHSARNLSEVTPSGSGKGSVIIEKSGATSGSIKGAREAVAGSSEALGSFGSQATPETQLMDIMRQQIEAGGVPARVGRGGFWGAAKNLQEILGMSPEDFERAWNNSLVRLPSGEVYNLPETHWVRGVKGETALLFYNPQQGVFEAVVGPGVEIGGAEKLLKAYNSLGKKVPTGVLRAIGRM